ncbi:MAG: domain S-box protein [Actinomycetia bacterium]|nr:domain S-box protein [Actinomycetes bacterium]
MAKRLDNLEAVLGYPLLERSPRGVRMTPQGRTFHARAEQLVQSAESLLDREDPAAEGLSGVHRLLGRQPARSTELLLADVERLLGHVLDTVSSGIVFHRVSDGIIIEANDAFCRMVGIPRDEVAGSPCPWHDDPRYASLHSAVEGGDVVRMSMVSQRPSGDEGAVELVARRIEIAGEDVLLIVVDDVTRARETERRLATRIRRQAVISRLGEMIPSALDVEEVLGATLEAARTELGLEAVGLLDRTDGEQLDQVLLLGDDEAGLVASAERYAHTWSRGEVVAGLEQPAEEQRRYVVCWPLPGRRGPSHVLVARTSGMHRLDDDARDFLRSITSVCAAALAATGELAA